MNIFPVFPSFDIELISRTLSVNVSFKLVSSKSENSLSESSKLVICFINFLSSPLIKWFLFTIDQDLGASVKDSFRCTFHKYPKAIFRALRVFLVFIHVANEHIELNLR